MATDKEIELILEKLEQNHPADFFKKINKGAAGIGAVLRYLNDAEKIVTAGDISRFMNVSTARVAILLRKMELKGLIVKENDIHDARVTAVMISEYGKDTVKEMRAELYSQIGVVIDRIGMERMIEFISISSEIRAVVKAPSIDLE